MAKRKGKKQSKKILGKIKKAPKAVKKAIRKAIKNNKGDRLKITAKEVRNIINKGATRKQIVKLGRLANKSKKLKIGGKIDTKKELRKTFKNQRLKGKAPGAKNNKTGDGGGRSDGYTGTRSFFPGSGLTIGGNTIEVSKDDGKGWNPKRIENRVEGEWSTRFKNYKGPQRLKVKRGKLPERLRKYSKYGKKTGEYKGFNTEKYMKDVRSSLRQRYKDKGGMISGKDKINRMIKRDGPKANFKVKPKYGETMNKLKKQLGGDVAYKKTLGSVTKALSEPPKVNPDKFKDTGMSILKQRTTEDAAVDRPTTTIRKKTKSQTTK